MYVDGSFVTVKREPGDYDAWKGKVYQQQDAKLLVRIVGQAPIARTSMNSRDCVATFAERSTRRRRRKAWAKKSRTTRRRP